jgi:hypothetical protein
MSRRDGAIVAWHEVPGTAPPQKTRPVGYGVIRAGVRTHSMIGVTRAMAHSALVSRRFRKRSITSNIIGHEPFKKSILTFLKKPGANFDEKYLWD